MNYTESELTYLRETMLLGTENRIAFDPEQPISEAAVADIKVPNIRAVYPLIRGINTEKLTINNTYYSTKAIKGKASKIKPTGYASFVSPYPKPIIVEHRLQDGFLTNATEPLGRIIWSAYKAHEKSLVVPSGNPLIPGFLQGEGALKFVACISDEQAIPKVLGSAYHTVSIGTKCGGMIESISGADLVALRRAGKEMPTFSKGTIYKIDGKEQLSYWMPFDLEGQECSYVNAPSDIDAGNEETDLGEDAVRLLLGEKKVGSKEYAFFDAKTLDKVLEMCDEEFSMFAPNLKFRDSVALPEYFQIGFGGQTESADDKELVTESAEFVVGDFVSIGKEGVGQVMAVKDATYLVREYQKGKPTLSMKLVDKKDAQKSDFKPVEAKKSESKGRLDLKKYFSDNFDPMAEFEKNSPISAPLLKLREKKVWSQADYEWAWGFKQISEYSNTRETLEMWGVSSKHIVDESTIEKMVATISEILSE